MNRSKGSKCVGVYESWWCIGQIIGPVTLLSGHYRNDGGFDTIVPIFAWWTDQW
jgi:hypothetical protein